MSEAGALMTGTVAGTAGGKQISDAITKSTKKTAKVLDAAAGKGAAAPKATTPRVEIGRSVPRTELNNVPPPPPPARRITASKPVRTRSVSVPTVMSAVIPGPPPEPVNVDLSSVTDGMKRANLLALGSPSARLTTSDDGHLIEIFQYHNDTLASGTVRLRDGTVYAVEQKQ